MKSIVERLLQESKGWKIETSSHGGPNFAWTKNCSFIWLNTEGEQIGFLSENEIKSFAKDFDEDEFNVNAILNLKPGEMFDVDGGINIYVRFK